METLREGFLQTRLDTVIVRIRIPGVRGVDRREIRIQFRGARRNDPPACSLNRHHDVHVAFDLRQVNSARSCITNFSNPSADLALDVEIPFHAVGAPGSRIDVSCPEVLDLQQCERLIRERTHRRSRRHSLNEVRRGTCQRRVIKPELGQRVEHAEARSN